MTIIIPVWLVIFISIVFIICAINRTYRFIKGLKIMWPEVKKIVEVYLNKYSQ